MICLKRKKCEKIINHLAQDYHSRHRKEANNKIAEIDIDYISKGLSNSTSKKLAVEYDYIDKLVDFLFQSLENDFPNLPLRTCKEFLISAVEVEYKKLPPITNTWLMQACLAQSQTVGQYRKAIFERLEQTKKNIENRCELSNEKRLPRKWWKDPKWLIGTAIALISVLVAVKQCTSPTASKNTNVESQTSGDFSPSVIQGPNSSLYLTYESSDQDQINRIERKVDSILQKNSKEYNEAFPLGYIIFTIESDSKEIKQWYGCIDPNWTINWDTAKATVEKKDLVIFTLPTLISPHRNRFWGNVFMSDIVGKEGVYHMEGVDIVAKIVEKYESGFICIIGLRKAK